MVHREPENLRPRRSLGDVVFLVACDACDGKPLRVAYGCLALPIYYIIYGSLVVSVEKSHIKDVLSEERLFADLGHTVLSVLVDNDNLRKVRAFAYEFSIILLLERDAHESFCLVGV